MANLHGPRVHEQLHDICEQARHSNNKLRVSLVVVTVERGAGLASG